VGFDSDKGDYGTMYFNRTLEDWINFRIDKRTKYDLSISSGLALIGAQKNEEEKAPAKFDEVKFFRRYKSMG
jgi:hypothetical protein